MLCAITYPQVCDEVIRRTGAGSQAVDDDADVEGPGSDAQIPNTQQLQVLVLPLWAPLRQNHVRRPPSVHPPIPLHGST